MQTRYPRRSLARTHNKSAIGVTRDATKNEDSGTSNRVADAETTDFVGEDDVYVYARGCMCVPMIAWAEPWLHGWRGVSLIVCVCECVPIYS